jgi:hypothetical protein
MMADSDEVVKAVACDIQLGTSVLDAYMLPDGEKRIGMTGVSLALGYTDKWFSNRTKRQSKWLESLHSIGYDGSQKPLSVIQRFNGRFNIPVNREATLATISVRDFTKVVTFEGTARRNLKAIVLMAAFMETGVENMLDLAFSGKSVEFILEKIVHYTKWTYEELEEVLAYNRDDVRSLYFPSSAFT